MMQEGITKKQNTYDMKKILLLSLLFMGPISSFSQVVEIRGIGDASNVDDKGATLPRAEADKKAIREAAINGIDKLLTQQSEGLKQQFNERARDNEDVQKVISNIINDSKVTTTLISEQKMIRATVEGSFDLQTLRDTLNRIPATTAQVKRAGNQVAVFFTVRTTDRVVGKSADKITQNESVDSTEKGSEEATEESVTVNESVEKTQSAEVTQQKTEFSEKAEMIADTKYKPLFGTGLMSQLSAKGFEEITDGSFFEISDEMDKDITARNDLKPATWRALIEEISKEGDGIEVVVVGSMDLSLPIVDPVSGLSSVEATISAKVYRIVQGRRQPSFIAGLAPSTVKGVGPTQENAKQSAVNAMSVSAANEIITQLKNNKVIE